MLSFASVELCSSEVEVEIGAPIEMKKTKKLLEIESPLPHLNVLSV